MLRRQTTKSDFMPWKTLPSPNFAAIDGQKLWGLKKSGGPGGAVAKSRQGAKKKRVESKKGRRQFLVSLRAWGGGGTSWLTGGTLIHYTTVREWETITSCVIYSDAYYNVSNQQIVCIDGLIVYFTMFYIPFVWHWNFDCKFLRFFTEVKLIRSWKFGLPWLLNSY